MKNALILHGINNNSQGNWFPWLKNELERRSWKVWAPDLPHFDRPSIDEVTHFILSNKNWSFNQDSVVIGHSAGAVSSLGILQGLPSKTVINTCILVSAFKNDLGRSDLSGLFTRPLNFEKVKNQAKKFILIHSDNDPYVPVEQAQYLSRKLGGELIIKKGQGHFNQDVGPQYKKFPLVLTLVDASASFKK